MPDTPAMRPRVNRSNMEDRPMSSPPERGDSAIVTGVDPYILVDRFRAEV
jgi:hypothetical protein